MKSFFDKIKPSFNYYGNLYYSLKYNLPIKNIRTVDFIDINRNYYYRLNNIIENINSLIIYSHDLEYLPNNINNSNLELRIWHYKGQKLPENWSINKLECFNVNWVKVLNINKPETFKTNE